MTFQLSPMQTAAADAVAKWFETKTKNPKDDSIPQFFYLAGYAGSGKTSIAKSIVSKLFPIGEAESLSDFDDSDDDPLGNSPFRYIAYTGKAALVLQRKGCDPASTIHGLVYNVHENETTREITFTRRNKVPKSLRLLIPDECSMINDEMANDILYFKTPCLFLGDPGQLPPIDGEGFFTTRSPDFFLSEIHRQAAESPILLAATAAREGRAFPSFTNTDETSVNLQVSSPTWARLLEYDQVLCGTNKLRTYLNDSMRLAQGFRTPASPNPIPAPGEKVICTRNNWNVPGMVNGAMFKVVSNEQLPPETIRYTDKYTKKTEHITLTNRIKFVLVPFDQPDAPTVEVKSHISFFDKTISPPKHKAEWSGLTQLDFGYAISVHKSQGSEWDNVFLFNEADKFRENRKQWLYTGITRAAKHLTIRL